MISDAEIGRNMATLSLAERLARAVLLFHSGGQWTPEAQELWRALTGKEEATTRALCDLAREVRKYEERQGAR